MELNYFESNWVEINGCKRLTDLYESFWVPGPRRSKVKTIIPPPHAPGCIQWQCCGIVDTAHLGLWVVNVRGAEVTCDVLADGSSLASDP